MTIFFTADTHFFHPNIVRYDRRPFANFEEMTEVLIKRWNARVRPGDTVYHLGDFALSAGIRSALPIENVFNSLSGHKWLIKGNHDRREVERCRWVKVSDYHELKVDLGGEHKQRIVLFHYACRVWNQIHRGAWMLHGHSHGNLSDAGGKTLDVGVTCHDYAPVSLEEVAEYMKNREIVTVDHHTLEMGEERPYESSGSSAVGE